MDFGRYAPTTVSYIRDGEFSSLTGKEINRKLGVNENNLYAKKAEDGFNRQLYLSFPVEGFSLSENRRLRFYIFLPEFERMSMRMIEAEPCGERITWDSVRRGETVAKNIIVGADITEAVKKALECGKTEFSCLLIPELTTPAEIKLTPDCMGLHYGKFEASLAYSQSLCEDKQSNAAIWERARFFAAEWVNEKQAKTYRKNADDCFALETLDISEPSQTHGVLVEGKGGNPVSSSGGFTEYKPYYARTLETLINEGGFVPSEPSEYDIYGGITNAGIKGTATGFYHTESHGERTYIIDPLGHPFFAAGANTINFGSTENQKKAILDRFGSEDAYWQFITKRLSEIGVNTVTGSVDKVTASELESPINGVVGLRGISAYMRERGLSTSTGGSSGFANHNTMNVFDPDFEPTFDRINRDTILKFRDNDRVIGYTSDNELPANRNLLERYLTLSPADGNNAYSYATAWAWLEARLGKNDLSFDELDSADIFALHEEFKSFVFGRLFEVAKSVIRRYDDNHMYIGTRVHGANRNSEGYLRAAGLYCDVLTINMYGGIQPPVGIMADIYRFSGKPFIVTEFYAKAADAKDMNGQYLGNQENAGWQVRTQADRGAYYDNYTTLLLECKYCVGWIWYRFQDNDQSLYTNDGGKTILRVFKKGARYAVASFLDSENNIIPATGSEVKIWEGETDTSNLGSNKGLFDNFMNEYEEVTAAYSRISRNLFGLICYFDALHS